MNSERIFKVILTPRISEKSTLLADKENQMIFDVALDANKLEIKKAVEALFNVKVESVRTSILKGKSKRFGRFEGKRSDVKKAYVKLAEGSDIDFVGSVEG